MHPAVRLVVSLHGGMLSPQNEPLKLLWLQNHRAYLVADAAFYDLAGWLEFKLTGLLNVCLKCRVGDKWVWGAVGGEEWLTGFWQAAETSKLPKNDLEKIGRHFIAPRTAMAPVSQHAADILRIPSTSVEAPPIVHAYAGEVWTVGIDEDPSSFTTGDSDG